MDFLRNLRIDRTSFWIGFVAGILFLFILSNLRRFIPFIVKAIRKQIQTAREKATASVLARFRQEVYLYAQHQHLADALFPLDEILIQPRVLAPPAFTSELEAGEANKADITSLTIPYMPDYPELGSLYGTPTLTLPEALQGGVNLILMGNPGTGRTVALANLASMIAKRDASVGKIADFIPVLVHAAWLLRRLSGSKPQKIHEILADAISVYTSPLTTAQIPNILRNALEYGRIFLMVDGFDEIHPDAQEISKNFLENLLKIYPKTRLIVVTGTDHYCGLNRLGLFPVAIAGWDEYDRSEFIQHWQEKWGQITTPNESEQTTTIDPLLIVNWLSTRDYTLTPLEFTLKVWGAFAGDVLGPDITNLLETHVRRLTVRVSNAPVVLQRLAVQMVVNLNLFSSQRQAERWVSRYEKVQPATQELEVEDTEKAPRRKKSAEKPGPTSEAIYNLINNGILTTQDGNLHFIHPVFLFYLAGQGLADSSYSTVILEQTDWSIKHHTCAFWGYYGDISPLVDAALSSEQDPVYSQVFRIARWLRVSTETSTWRIKLMRQLVDILHKESITAGIGCRAITALALSGDPGINTLFRQMIKGNLAHLRYLGALGCGFLRDAKSVNELSALFIDDDPRINGAVCLALVAIGSKSALEAVMTLLLQGSEIARRLAAEALANNVVEGHPALEEATTMPDLLVRRSAVFGLARVRQPWAVQILEKMEIEDGQWVVRTAANQVLEEMRQPDPHIPKPLPTLTDTPWLINFAGKLGMGVASGKQALELIGKALESGEPREKLNALEYLQQNGREEVLLQIYQTYFGSQAVLREAAFNTLWHYQASGVKLPPPIQYGLH